MSRAGCSGGMFKRIEVVIFGFHFGAVEHGEAEGGKEIFDFGLNLRDRMQAAGARAGSGQRQVDPFALETLDCRAASSKAFFFDSKAAFEGFLGGVQGLARRLSAPPATVCRSSLLNWASEPLRPSTSMRTASSSSRFFAASNALERGGLKLLRSLASSTIYSAPCIFEQFDHCGMAFGQREIERRSDCSRRARSVSAPRAISRLRNFHIAILRGGMQGCPTALAAAAFTSAPWASSTAITSMWRPAAAACSGRVLHGVARPRMDIRAIGQQDLRACRGVRRTRPGEAGSSRHGCSCRPRAVVGRAVPRRALAHRPWPPRKCRAARPFREAADAMRILPRIARHRECAEPVLVRRRSADRVGVDHLRHLSRRRRRGSHRKILCSFESRGHSAAGANNCS